MQYLILLLAFLAECTLRPSYINTTLTVEIITITYFIILLKTKYSIPTYFPALLLLIANIATHAVIGLESLLLMVASFVCHAAFINGRQQMKIGSHGGKSPLPTPLSIAAFAIVFLLITLLRAIILQMLGHHTVFTSEVTYYIVNVSIFIVIALCI